MKILVTGGAGYIGGFMTERLLDDGYEVIVADSNERGHKETIDARAITEIGDLSDEQFLKELFTRHTFSAVIHFAGYISMKESMEDPGIYFINNVNMPVKVLETMRAHGVKKFIFSSSAGVYGNPEYTPIPENHPTNPTNPYGQSKLMVEQILYWYQQVHGINSVCLRYFNAAGAALDASRGEDHLPETHIIPNIIRAALAGETFTLYGGDYETKDGTCVRDYIHVLDLAQAHVLALQKLEKDNGAFIYNVGTGNGYSNKEVVDVVKKVAGIDIKVAIESRRPGDSHTLVADATKIKKDLGFVTQYSDLETIVKTAWEWHKKMKNEK